MSERIYLSPPDMTKKEREVHTRRQWRKMKRKRVQVIRRRLSYT